MKRQSGFTLTELLIVVTITGILSIIAIPKFFPAIEKGRVSEAIATLSLIRQAEKAYSYDNAGAFQQIDAADCNAAKDALWNAMGMDNPNCKEPKHFAYTVSTSPNFYILATRQNLDDAGSYSGKFIKMNSDGKSCSGAGSHPLIPASFPTELCS